MTSVHRHYSLTAISGFRCDVETCVLLGCYAASCGNFFFTEVSGKRIGPIFNDQTVQEEKDFLVLEDRTDMLSRNVGKLPHDAA
jgi:hypothetical protein